MIDPASPALLNLIALDTTQFENSVVLACGDQMYRSTKEASRAAHQATDLIPMVQRLLQQANLDWPDLNGLCVSRGPGSFTGIRIGLATAQGFIIATDIKPFAPSSLETWAFHALQDAPGTTTVLIAMDNRREGYFSQAFQKTKDKDIRPLNVPRISSPQDIITTLKAHPDLILVSNAPPDGLKAHEPPVSLAQTLIEYYHFCCQTHTLEAYQTLSPLYVHDPKFKKLPPDSSS